MQLIYLFESLGESFSQQKSNKIWESIRLEKEKGGYPWTHLSHNQDEEIWLNPQKLPPDIGRYVMHAACTENQANFHFLWGYYYFYDNLIRILDYDVRNLLN